MCLTVPGSRGRGFFFLFELLNLDCYFASAKGV